MDVVAALLPSAGVALLFWFAVRAMVNADRRERQATARLERAERRPSGDPADEVHPPPS